MRTDPVPDEDPGLGDLESKPVYGVYAPAGQEAIGCREAAFNSQTIKSSFSIIFSKNFKTSCDTLNG
jgi:hypothetical protein